MREEFYFLARGPAENWYIVAEAGRGRWERWCRDSSGFGPKEMPSLDVARPLRSDISDLVFTRPHLWTEDPPAAPLAAANHCPSEAGPAPAVAKRCPAGVMPVPDFVQYCLAEERHTFDGTDDLWAAYEWACFLSDQLALPRQVFLSEFGQFATKSRHRSGKGNSKRTIYRLDHEAVRGLMRVVA